MWWAQLSGFKSRMFSWWEKLESCIWCGKMNHWHAEQFAHFMFWCKNTQRRAGNNQLWQEEPTSEVPQPQHVFKLCGFLVGYLLTELLSAPETWCCLCIPTLCVWYWQPHECQKNTDDPMNIGTDTNMPMFLLCVYIYIYMSVWVPWDLTSPSSPAILETCLRFGNSSRELLDCFSSAGL